MWNSVRSENVFVCMFSVSEKRKFSLKGPQNQGKRFRIYRFLLKNFTDEQRFIITTKICQDILGKSCVWLTASCGVCSVQGLFRFWERNLNTFKGGEAVYNITIIIVNLYSLSPNHQIRKLCNKWMINFKIETNGIFYTKSKTTMKQILSLISSKRGSIDVTLTDSSLLQPVLWTLSCLWILRAQSCLQIHLTSCHWKRWNWHPWAAQQQERNLRRMRWPWLKRSYRWPRKSWSHRWGNILKADSEGGPQTNVWSLLNFPSVWCSGPKEELCGECYPYHHQSKKHAGGATFTCPETPYGLPTGDAYRCD